MAVETTSFTVDGLSFQSILLPALDAGALDIQVNALIVPVLASIENFSLDSEISPKMFFEALTKALQSLTKEKFKQLMTETLINTSYLQTNKPAQQLSEPVINEIFRGKLLTLYKTFGEVIKFNKFLPFELMEAGGLEMKEIISSLVQTKEATTSGKESETSGS